MRRIIMASTLLCSLQTASLAADMSTIEYDCKHHISKELNGLSCSIRKLDDGYWLDVRIYTELNYNQDQRDHRHYVEGILIHNFFAVGGYGVQQRRLHPKTGARIERACFPIRRNSPDINCQDWLPAHNNWQ